MAVVEKDLEGGPAEEVDVSLDALMRPGIKSSTSMRSKLDREVVPAEDPRLGLS
jgi:hypothetical protein